MPVLLLPSVVCAAGQEIVVMAAMQGLVGVPKSGDTDFLLGRTPSLLPHAGSTPFPSGILLGRTHKSRGLLWG